MNRHVETLKSAISETALSSIALYHISSATHATEPTQGHGSQSGTTEMRKATRHLRESIAQLAEHFEHDAAAHQGLAALLHNATLLAPPQDMQQIWHETRDQRGVHALLQQQFSMCRRICMSPDMSISEKSTNLRILNDTVVNQLLPRLKRLRLAASEWQQRLLGVTNIVILAAFGCVVASILFTRFGVVGPLLRDLDAANASLSTENDKLEKKVALRTDHLLFALDRAEAAHEARTRFLASVNHEMRTPLNGVLGVAALLQTTELNGRQKGLVDTISKSGQILVRLIDDVLDYVSLNAGKMELITRPVLLRAVIAESLDLLRPVALAKGLELHFDCYSTDDVTVDVDPERLQQIVNNIVGNAIKFTQTGSVWVTMHQILDVNEVLVTLSVQDSGAGIENDRFDRLFEPFDRAALGVPTPGAGLGLAVTKALVEQMDGTVSVESEPGHGARFTIKIRVPTARAVATTVAA